MKISLKDIIGLTKELPEECFNEVYEKLSEIKEKAASKKEQEANTKVCPHCKSPAIVRNGKRHNRQAYICRNCAKTFVETTGSPIANTSSSKTVWRAVIRDTVNGLSLAKTAASLDLHHETVFYMRHKILMRIEQELADSPIYLNGVCEADETYVLESEKGRKFPENHHRKPRKNGGRASKRGISNEQICVCTSINGDGKCVAVSVNRAMPSKAELVQVFESRITDDSVILCDGNKNYDVFEGKCTVAHLKNLDKINNFHSFIKERLRAARGVATTYLNRYNALFAKIFGSQETAVDKIYELMTACDDSVKSNDDVDGLMLLSI
jgi:transposase-like protein